MRIVSQEESEKKEGILFEKRLKKNYCLNLGAVWLSHHELEYGRWIYISSSEGGRMEHRRDCTFCHCATKEKEKMRAERPQEKMMSFIY